VWLSSLSFLVVANLSLHRTKWIEGVNHPVFLN
jgi:hypothetical protein